jgi:hypothetical protein
VSVSVCVCVCVHAHVCVPRACVSSNQLKYHNMQKTLRSDCSQEQMSSESHKLLCSLDSLMHMIHYTLTIHRLSECLKHTAVTWGNVCVCVCVRVYVCRCIRKCNVNGVDEISVLCKQW